MNFNDRIRIFTAVSAICLLLTVALHINRAPIHRGAESFISSVFELYETARYGKPDRTAGPPLYESPYRDIPAAFMRAGSLLLYQVAEGTTLEEAVTKCIDYTVYPDRGTLRREIIKTNGLSSKTPLPKVLIIPGAWSPLEIAISNSEPAPIQEVRAIYLTGPAAGRSALLNRLKALKSIGVNGICFDVKDIPGIISYRTDIPEALKYGTSPRRTSIDNPGLLLRRCAEAGIYTIARIAVFHDHLLAKQQPSFAIRSKRTGGVWNKGRREIWCDPTNKSVQDYNIALAVEMAKMGADEIQFDYIRFPTTGDLKDASYAYEFGKMSNENAIAHFLKRASAEIKKHNTRLSIDIYGVVAWGKEVDIRVTGQRIALLSPHCDYISPMLYPSHFNDGFDGYGNPGDHPYRFMKEGVARVLARAGKGNAAIRPWLQAFGWRVTNYNADYILEQIKAVYDSGGTGFLFWNASSSYDTVYRAMMQRYKR